MYNNELFDRIKKQGKYNEYGEPTISPEDEDFDDDYEMTEEDMKAVEEWSKERKKIIEERKANDKLQ